MSLTRPVNLTPRNPQSAAPRTEAVPPGRADWHSAMCAGSESCGGARKALCHEEGPTWRSNVRLPPQQSVTMRPGLYSTVQQLHTNVNPQLVSSPSHS